MMVEKETTISYTSYIRGKIVPYDAVLINSFLGINEETILVCMWTSSILIMIMKRLKVLSAYLDELFLGTTSKYLCTSRGGI